MAKSHESVSEQSRRRTSWILSIIGIAIAILFLLVLCSKSSEQVQREQPVERKNFTLSSTIGKTTDLKAEMPDFSVKGAELIVSPNEITFDNVVLGAQAEGVLTLRAEKGPVFFEKRALAVTSEDGMVLGGECMERTQLNAGEECLLKVFWKPTLVQTLQNTLTIVWREDSSRAFEGDNQRTQIQIKASATDSKECVCCEVEKEKAEKVRRKVVTVDGREIEINDDGTVVIDGEVMKVIGEIVFDKDGNPVGALQPEQIALGLNNEYLGRVTDRRTVVDQSGKTLGRLLGDDTLVDPDFNVLGVALPIVSIIDAQGVAVGKMKVDDAGVHVVNAKDVEIGQLRADRTVVDKAGVQVGMLRPWGATLDLSGDFMGVILPDGQVVNSKSVHVGNIQQNGFVLDDKGALIGGAVPLGMAVGTGCRSFGAVGFNGKVKDIYGQIIGRVMLDGGVVDANFNTIGQVVSQGLVIDMNGKILGFVNSEGKAVDGKGKLIGCVAPNGTVSAGKKTLGGVLQKGMVTANSCSVIGSVYPNGHVMSNDVKEVGVIRADGFAINASKKVIGAVVPHGTVMGAGCHLMGVISVTGQIVNEQKMSLGCVNMQKQALDMDGREIGKITPTGSVIAPDGTLAGRVRYDGKIINRKGEVIDCVNPDGTSSVGVVVSNTGTGGSGSGGNVGVVVGDNGEAKPWTIMDNVVYNENNEAIGTIAPNGVISDDKGNIVGFIPPDGVVFSATGTMLGTYNSKMGLLDLKEGNLGYVMPDLTVLDTNKTKILGTLIPSDTVFVNFEGGRIGQLTHEGTVVNEAGKVVGRVFADGSLYNQNNVLIGGAVTSGAVFGVNGRQVGWANANGDVVQKGTRIASLLPNGLAITPDNRVLGRVWSPISVMVSAQGVAGTVVLKASESDKTTYQSAAFDKAGNYLGRVSPFGVLLGTDGRLGGVAEPMTMVMDTKNTFIGWIDFKGQVVNPEGNVIGNLIMNNLVVNAEGKIIGSLARKGTVVDDKGVFVGRVGPDGKIYNGAGASGFDVGQGAYIFNKDLSKSMRLLPEGLALSSDGKMLGWTTFDGRIMNSKNTVGLVSLNDRIMDEAGQVIASYVPLGAPSVQEKENMCGIMDESGAVIASSGRPLGKVLAPDYAVENNTIVGRIRTQSQFVRGVASDDLVGIAGLDSLVYRPNTARQTGELMMNDFVADASKKVVGGLVPSGFAISQNLKPFGTEDYSGVVWLGGKMIGVSSGDGVILHNKANVTGGVFVPEVIVDKNGMEIGRTNALAAVVDQSGKRIASRMAFYSALTPETIWAGGPLRTGVVVDDHARKKGVVAGDGAMIYDGGFKGRVLADGSVAGVSDRAVFNTMPYVGRLAKQGLPLSYEGAVLGRTTIQGDVVDASGKVLFQTLDDGSILGKERPLEGQVLSFVPAVSKNNTVLGMLNGNGKIVDATGNEVGRVATNGAVKGGHELENLGALIPESLVVHDCQVIGQTAYNGEVIDGKGNTIGRMQPDLWAEDPQGRRLGHPIMCEAVVSPATPAVYLGRVLPDSTIVDPSGVIIGCVRDDNSAVRIQNVGSDGKIDIGTDPEVIGHCINRGPIIDEDGNITGRADSTGRIIGVDNGDPIGYVSGDGKNQAFTFDHKPMGYAAGKYEELLFDPEGKVRGTFDVNRNFRSPRGDLLFQVTKTGKVVDPWGNEIGTISEKITNYVYLYDMTDKPVAHLDGCELKKLPGNEKMGNLLANGEIRDDSQELILVASIDNKVFNPDGTQFGRFDGFNVDLRRCGLSDKEGGSGTRKIVWGGKTLEYDPKTGMIIDPKTGKVIGSWDEVNGRPYIWDTANQKDDPTRPPPPLPKRPVISKETQETYVGNVNDRRIQMKQKMGSMGSAILPNYSVEQVAQATKSNDWSSVGVDKSNISTWPVDMSRVLLADKAIPAVLQRSIDSRYPDVPVTAIVERHIYGEAGRNILIPAGSRLIGQASSSSGAFGANQAAKMEITWRRLIRPDGAAFKFDAVSGDAQGRGGVAAYLDLQLLKKFGLPFVSTLGEGLILKLTELNEKQVLSGASGASGVDSTVGETPAHQTRKMFIDNFKEMWSELMDMAGEIPNIVYVPAGTRLVAFSKEDLWLRSEEDEAEPQSNSTKRYSPGKTSVSNNGSWTERRSQSQSNSGSTGSQQGNTPQNSGSTTTPNEQVYPQNVEVEPIEPAGPPSDLGEREVKPVSVQNKPSYF